MSYARDLAKAFLSGSDKTNDELGIDSPPPWAAVLCVGEEAGEFIGAYRRFTGYARRAGSFDDVKAELADVVVAAYATADILNFDLDEAVKAKGEVIMSRGFRDKR